MTDQQGKKVDAEIAKLIAETAKLNKETFWYPMALATGLVLSVGAVMKFIL
ncbi:hypothetical protein MNB_SUP05-SYMBIONT-5-769 [hydrothermal vent metagenome]|uniref:Uncharacterized protein n=1 Tax=hydrothermal vent metagenome TaxID=652676 RepID=A0A1W1E4H6_9ZZZZ